MTKFKDFFNFWKFEIGLFAAFAFLYFIILPFVPIIDGDTFYYIARAKKILHTGDWFNLSSFISKPLLGIWCIALTYKLFGLSLFSTYLWHTFFGLGTLVVVYLFMLEFMNRETARLSAAILFTSLMFFYQLCSPMLDIPMVFFLVLAQWFLYKYIYYGEARYLYLTAFASGLNFLTKGLLGAALPAITFVLYLVFTKTNPFKEYKNIVLHTLVAVLVFIALAALWVAPQCKVYGKEFLDSWYKENIVRFFKPIDETGGYRAVSSDVQRDPHVNIIYIVLSLLPWSPFLMPLLIKAFRDKKFYAKRELVIFLLCWFLFVAFITTISGHYKGPRYLLPFFPAAAMLIGIYLNERLVTPAKNEHQKLIVRSFGFIVAVLALFIAVIALAKFTHGEEQYRPFVLSFLGFYMVVHICGAYFWKKTNYRKAINTLLFFAFLSYAVFLVQGTAYIKKIYPDYGTAKYLRAYPNKTVAVWKMKIRSLDFYLDRSIKYYGTADELRRASGKFLLVAEKGQLSEIKKIRPKFKEIYNYSNWQVLEF